MLILDKELINNIIEVLSVNITEQIESILFQENIGDDPYRPDLISFVDSEGKVVKTIECCYSIIVTDAVTIKVRKTADSEAISFVIALC